MSGGGVALGPKPRSYAQHTPKKMVRLALLSALSDRADIGRIVVLDEWGIEEPDTREAATILRKLRLKGSVLVVLANDQINLALSLRNLPEASITTHAELSAHDVIKADWLLFSDRTLPTSPSDFSGTHVVEAAPAKKATKAEKTAAPAKKATKAEKTAAPAKTAPQAETDAAEDPPAKKARATRTAEPVVSEAAPTDEAAGPAPADETPSEEGDADA
jgi:hypothetical protein